MCQWAGFGVLAEQSVANTERNVLTIIKLIFFAVACVGLFLICAESNFDHPGIFSFLLSIAYTDPRTFLLLAHPTSEQDWGTRS